MAQQRFKQHHSGGASKIETKVTFPLKLDMFPYTTRAAALGENKHSPDMSRGCTYDLQSVVVHVGNLETGHYVCYSRVGQQVCTFFPCTLLSFLTISFHLLLDHHLLKASLTISSGLNSTTTK